MNSADGATQHRPLAKPDFSLFQLSPGRGARRFSSGGRVNSLFDFTTNREIKYWLS